MTGIGASRLFGSDPWQRLNTISASDGRPLYYDRVALCYTEAW